MRARARARPRDPRASWHHRTWRAGARAGHVAPRGCPRPCQTLRNLSAAVAPHGLDMALP
eukprot:15443289-Alexandrium_andersonii.AAC.1